MRTIASCARCGKPQPVTPATLINLEQAGRASADPGAAEKTSLRSCQRCRRPTCLDCWNASAGRCLSCAPSLVAERGRAKRLADKPDVSVCRRCGLPLRVAPAPAPGSELGTTAAGDLRLRPDAAGAPQPPELRPPAPPSPELRAPDLPAPDLPAPDLPGPERPARKRRASVDETLLALHDRIAREEELRTVPRSQPPPAPAAAPDRPGDLEGRGVTARSAGSDESPPRRLGPTVRALAARAVGGLARPVRATARGSAVLVGAALASMGRGGSLLLAPFVSTGAIVSSLLDRSVATSMGRLGAARGARVRGPRRARAVLGTATTNVGAAATSSLLGLTRTAAMLVRGALGVFPLIGDPTGRLIDSVVAGLAMLLGASTAAVRSLGRVVLFVMGALAAAALWLVASVGHAALWLVSSAIRAAVWLGTAAVRGAVWLVGRPFALARAGRETVASAPPLPPRLGSLLGTALGSALAVAVLAVVAGFVIFQSAGRVQQESRRSLVGADGTPAVPAATATRPPPATASTAASPAGGAPSAVSTPPVTGASTGDARVARAVAPAWRDRSGSVRAQVVVEVVNRGKGLLLLAPSTTTYEIRTRSGSPLHAGLFAYAFPHVIGPNESAYLIDTVDLDFVTPADVGSVRATVRARPAAGRPTALRVSGVSWTTGPDGGIVVSGSVANTSPRNVTRGVLGVVLLGARGEILGGVYDITHVGTIGAGRRVSFRTGYPGTPPVPAASVRSVRAFAFDLEP